MWESSKFQHKMICRFCIVEVFAAIMRASKTRRICSSSKVLASSEPVLTFFFFHNNRRVRRFSTQHCTEHQHFFDDLSQHCSFFTNPTMSNPFPWTKAFSSEWTRPPGSRLGATGRRRRKRRRPRGDASSSSTTNGTEIGSGTISRR
jgi:hypothetical protein